MFNILELNLNSNLNSLILETNLSCYVILVMEFLGCHTECRCLIAWTSRARLERASVWLLVQDKLHEIKNINSYDYNFYFVQIQF
jgi:hypothetical protein